MNNKPLAKAILCAHHLALAAPCKKIAVDATMGNGHDTLFLAQHFKKVFGFDIQEKALNRSRVHLQDCTNTTLLHASYLHISQYVEEAIDVVIFNLGFLPGSDKKITTNIYEVLQAIENMTKKIQPNGRIIIVVYTRHNENYDFPILQSYLLSHTFFYELYEDFEFEKVVCIYPHLLR